MNDKLCPFHTDGTAEQLDSSREVTEWQDEEMMAHNEALELEFQDLLMQFRQGEIEIEFLLSECERINCSVQFDRHAWTIERTMARDKKERSILNRLETQLHMVIKFLWVKENAESITEGLIRTKALFDIGVGIRGIHSILKAKIVEQQILVGDQEKWVNALRFTLRHLAKDIVVSNGSYRISDIEEIVLGYLKSNVGYEQNLVRRERYLKSNVGYEQNLVRREPQFLGMQDMKKKKSCPATDPEVLMILNKLVAGYTMFFRFMKVYEEKAHLVKS